MNNTSLYGEIWKEIKFDFEYTNLIKIEVSNFGRVRSIKPKVEPNILKGTMINGYKTLRLKFFKTRDAESQAKLELMRKEMADLKKEVSNLQKQIDSSPRKDMLYFDTEKKMKRKMAMLDEIKKKYDKDYKASDLKRTIYGGELVHRMVAKHFLEQPTPLHTIVAHKDYNRLNNNYTNLVWMTKEEHLIHQRKSPFVLAARERRKNSARNEGTKIYKLTSSQVMLIKKKINQGVSLRTLSKSFKVTETQLLRIKRGQNWGNVEAAV
jgi:hypothetical protein